jgi:predicted metal-binding membrane protein
MITESLTSEERASPFDATAAAVLGSAALGWLALLALSTSPWTGFFGHAALQHLGAHPWAVAFMAAGWILMVVAMMLPTTLPLLALFGRVTAEREDRWRLRAILVGAYVLVWVAAGAVMHAGDFGIHRLVDHWHWLANHTWMISAGTLVLAGFYQFTGAKSRCLRRCRTPQSFLRRHWRGGPASVQALRIGLDHGAYCVGCCWSLMLVMFSVGVGNIVWMLLLTTLMVIEKTARLGQRASAPIGIWLLIAALLTAASR